MPEYIKFDSVKPPVREIPDAAAWVQAELQSSIDGQAWETFEGPLTLSPAITNGKNPPPYSFTSVDAPDTAIYFRLLWIDANGFAQPTISQTRPTPLPAWAPGLSDVASHIPIRTKDTSGSVLGTFTDKTAPATAEAVSLLIAKGVRRVRPMFASPITDPEQAETARDLAALWTAMLVELGLFPEQVNTEQSPYDRLKDLWDDETGGDQSGGGSDSDDVIGDSHTAPAYLFPCEKPLRW
jgi:hypothetical protein